MYVYADENAEIISCIMNKAFRFKELFFDARIFVDLFFKRGKGRSAETQKKTENINVLTLVVC